MAKYYLVLVISLLAVNCKDAPQKKESENPLDGLHLVDRKKSDDENFVLTDTSNIFDTAGQKLKKSRALEKLMTGRYIAKQYADEDENIKAYVIQKASKEEKSGFLKDNIKNEIKKWKGKSLPDTTLKDLDGNTWNFDQLKGKVAVFNFWYINCRPCILEIPKLNKLVADYETNDSIVFLALSEDTKPELENFTEIKSFDYNIIPEAEQYSSRLGIKSFPTHMILGKDGIVEFTYTGLGPNTIKKMRSKIQQLIG